MQGYGYFDLSYPDRVHHRDGYTSLGEVWREIRGMAYVGIVHLDTNREIYKRGSSRPYRKTLTQYDLFGAVHIINPTKKQRNADKPQQLELFAAPDVLQFGVNGNPLIPITDKTLLGMPLETQGEPHDDLIPPTQLSF